MIGDESIVAGSIYQENSNLACTAAKNFMSLKCMSNQVKSYDGGTYIQSHPPTFSLL